MGYCIEQMESEFFIPVEKLEDCKNAVLNAWSGKGRLVGFVKTIPLRIKISQRLPKIVDGICIWMIPETSATFASQAKS